MRRSSFDGADDEALRRPLVEPADAAEGGNAHHDVRDRGPLATAPISGQVPSPSSGVHTLRDGANLTIGSPTNRRLRHRHQSPQQAPRPPRQPQLQQQHLDDADAAAGMRVSVVPPHYQRSATEGTSPTKGRSHGGASGSRSLGSRTPEAEKRLFHNMQSSRSYDERARHQISERHSEDFFHHTGTPSPPRAPPTERGLRRGAYGGSEHDFLTLSARSSVRDDGSASSGGSHSQHDNLVSRRRYHPQIQVPPLEITTGGISRGSSYPPYGLPTIEGSPALSDAKTMAQLREGVPPPPVSPLSAEADATFVVLGWDLSSHSRRSQFLISASGTFGFSLLYGYLQELISVELCGRKLGLFLALAQFTGYTILSYFFRKLDTGASAEDVPQPAGSVPLSRRLRRLESWGRLRGKMSEQSTTAGGSTVPMELYVGLSMLRAIDLAMTNLAMQYVNYPAKTLMKSTRVLFTMIFGVVITRKRYGVADYGIVGLMVTGLMLFMHADAHSSAVFRPLGILMLTISLLCDGAISNLSEALMRGYNVGQDEFIFRLYSIATFFICIAAAVKGDLRDGLVYLIRPGTVHEMEEGLEPTWTAFGKIMTLVVFSTVGFLSSSCSAAITKSFGALTMSITSTARKAATIFLSFALFPNECSAQHISGIFLFIASLVAKSLRASKRDKHHDGRRRRSPKKGGGCYEYDALRASSPLHHRRKVPGDENC
ncbi:hypothetical protein ACHAXT_003311 [Thalassiosira profunda]